jgi:S1-C subfamily serine protease
VILQEVQPNSPAAAAGLRANDMITQVNGTPIRHGGDLRRVLRGTRPGATIRINGVRPGAGEFSVQARLAGREVG